MTENLAQQAVHRQNKHAVRLAQDLAHKKGFQHTADTELSSNISHFSSGTESCDASQRKQELPTLAYLQADVTIGSTQSCKSFNSFRQYVLRRGYERLHEAVDDKRCRADPLGTCWAQRDHVKGKSEKSRAYFVLVQICMASRDKCGKRAAYWIDEL